MARLRVPNDAVTLQPETGRMVGFENRRVLHGRDAFGPDTGQRTFAGSMSIAETSTAESGCVRSTGRRKNESPCSPRNRVVKGIPETKTPGRRHYLRCTERIYINFDYCLQGCAVTAQTARDPGRCPA
jgi:hypothetical protein